MSANKLNPFKLNDFLIEPNRNIIVTASDEVPVQAKVMDVLVVLSERQNQTVSRTDLIEQVWQGNEYVGKQGVTRSISILRSIFQDSASDPAYIETIPQRGYRLLVSPISIYSTPEGSRRLLFVAVLAIVFAMSALIVYWNGIGQVPAYNYQVTSYPFVSLLPGNESVPSVSQSGSLAFNSEVNGTNKLVVVNNWADAKESEVLLEAKKPLFPLWSPTGKRLAVSGQDCQITVFAGSSASEQALNCEKGTHTAIAWISDTELLYVNTQGVFDVYESTASRKNISRPNLIRALNLMTKKPTYLAHHYKSRQTALMLPSDMQNYRLLLISSDGKTKSGPDIYQAAKGLSWLDENHLLVSSRTKGRFELSQVDTLTWTRTPFNISVAAEARFPAICTGCKHVAYERFSLGSRLTRLDLSNAERESVANMIHARYERYPVRSSGGGLAFVANDGHDDNLYVLQSTSTEPVKLDIPGTLVLSYPGWSNSGDSITFLGGDDTGTNVYSISLKDQRVIKHTARGTFGPPRFSRDDDLIYSGKLSLDGNWQLYSINRETDETLSLPIQATMAVPVSDETFLTVTLGQPDIYLSDLEGGSRRIIEQSNELLGAWTYRDGIISVIQNEPHWSLVRLLLRDGEVISRYQLPELSMLNLQTIVLNDQSLTFVEQVAEDSNVVVARFQ